MPILLFDRYVVSGLELSSISEAVFYKMKILAVHCCWLLTYDICYCGWISVGESGKDNIEIICQIIIVIHLFESKTELYNFAPL